MKYKKGVIEIQFNWLFVLIIGAVILILFSGIIIRQKNISEISKNALILNNLNAILSGSEISQGTINVVDIPKTKIEFRCNRYSIGKLSKQLDVMNVFTPSVLESDRLIPMTLDFSIPYRVTNLIYLTSPNYRYVFVGNDDTAKEMINMMPNESFSEIFSDSSSLSYRGENKVRLIFFNIGRDDNVPTDFISVSDNDVTALNVDGNLESGRIEFFRKSGNKFESSGTSDYLGKETLLGSIFSDNPEVYNCVMDNVFEKINIVTQIYIDKTNRIKEQYKENNDRCVNLAIDLYKLDNLNQILDASESFSTINIGKIPIAVDNLKTQNRDAQLQSCATIY